MSRHRKVPYETTLLVRDHCLCLYLQCAARKLARFFDDRLRPLDLTNGQFSLLMSLNRPAPPDMKSVSSLLTMDRTTLTAALKPLERRGLIKTIADPNDKRSRLMMLTPAGHRLLLKAFPIWKESHAYIDEVITANNVKRLRGDLQALAWAM